MRTTHWLLQRLLVVAVFLVYPPAGIDLYFSRYYTLGD
jgi:hypothetical protein